MNTAAAVSPYVPSRNGKPVKESMSSRGHRLKDLYPEMESWGAGFLARVWLVFTRTNGLKADVPEERDEAFPEYVVQTLMDMAAARDPKCRPVMLPDEIRK